LKITDITNEDYHSRPGYSASFGKMFLDQSPLHAKESEFNLSAEIEENGNGYHANLLEPEKDLIIEGPETRRGKAWSEAKELADLDGKILVTAGVFKNIQAMTEKTLANPACNKLLTHPERRCEESYFIKEPTGIITKARPDLLIEKTGVVADLKSTSGLASPKGFLQSAIKFNYFFQAAWYSRILRLEGFAVKKFIFVVCEKAKPNAVLAHEVSSDAIDYYTPIVENTIKEIAECHNADQWPTGWGHHNVLELPQWMRKDDFDG